MASRWPSWAPVPARASDSPYKLAVHATPAKRKFFARGTLLNLSPRRLLSALVATSLLYAAFARRLHLLSGKSVMRNWLISLSALVLVAFSARAQHPFLLHSMASRRVPLRWWLPARFSLDRWTISGNSCQGWSQQWPKNRGHSSMSGASIQTRKLIT